MEAWEILYLGYDGAIHKWIYDGSLSDLIYGCICMPNGEPNQQIISMKKIPKELDNA